MAFNPEYSNTEPARAEIDALAGANVVEFGNSWCGYCRRARPLVEAAINAHPSVRHLKFADGPGQPLGRSFHVTLWPTLVFMRDGREVAKLVRPVDEASIREALARIDAGASQAS
jgi:thioredoxin 1